MPYKDKVKQREAQRKSMSRARNVKPCETLNRNHPLLIALVDPDKRIKLTRICRELENKSLLGRLWFGPPYAGISFEVVIDYLDATK